MTKKNKKVCMEDLYNDGLVGLLVYLPIPNELVVAYKFNHSLSFVASERLEGNPIRPSDTDKFEVIDYVRLY